MKLRDCVLDCPMTGVCTIDVDKVCKLWPKLKNTFISFVKNKSCGSDYRLVNYKAGIKIDISDSDAKAIISRLSLTEIPSSIFRASTFILDPQ